MLAVRLAQVGGQSLLLEVLSRERDRGARKVHTGHDRTATRKAHEVGAGAAANFEDAFAVVAVEIHQPKQVVQLLEVILIEILEKARGADGMCRDLEVVYVLVPVV